MRNTVGIRGILYLGLLDASLSSLGHCCVVVSERTGVEGGMEGVWGKEGVGE